MTNATQQLTIIDAFISHTETQGEATAFTYLKSDLHNESISFYDLDKRARAIAGKLLQYATPGDRAMLMYPAGLEFIEAFLGCLYAGIIAVPSYPPKKNRNGERILSIVQDCDPSLLLCTSSLQTTVQEEIAANTSDCEVLVTDQIMDSSEFQTTDISPEQIAFLQYTSGSTATPKGVMVTHSNLLANEQSIQKAFGHDKDSVVCGWLPTYHDMGLIGLVLQPLFVGCHSLLISPVSFLSKPVRWLKMISDFRVTTTGGPNFSYDHCVNLINDDECENLDLSSLKVVFNGSEPIDPETLDQFSNKFEEFGFDRKSFFPCYGLAESTLFVSGGPSEALPQSIYYKENESDPRHIISCGKISEDLEIVIANPENDTPVPDGKIGEIWIQGESVTKGYWRQPSLSVESFQARLCTTDVYLDNNYFRTGDLGFIKDDQLFVTGRLKDMIIYCGRNIYPQDIEQVIEKQFNFSIANSVAAFSVMKNDRESIAVVIEASRCLVQLAKQASKDDHQSKTASIDEFKTQLKTIRKEININLDVRVEYFAFLPPGKFPRTTSGKVQRKTCKTALINGDLPFLNLPECVTSLTPTINR